MMTRFFAGAIAPAAAFLAACPYAQGQSKDVALYKDMPMQFEADAGQTDASVKFLARGANSAVFLTAEGAVLSLGPHANGLRMSLAGSNTRSALIGVDPLPGKVKYLNGNDQLAPGASGERQTICSGTVPGRPDIRAAGRPSPEIRSSSTVWDSGR